MGLTPEPRQAGRDRLAFGAFLRVICLLFLTACSTAADKGAAGQRRGSGVGPSGDTSDDSGGVPSALLEHARECAAELGPPPAWDILADSLDVPITVDGVPLQGDAWHSAVTCDRPDLLQRSCVPHTRVGWKQGTTTEGEDDPDVDWVITFRRDDPTTGPGLGRYHDVAMIGHRVSTGATCFFQAFPNATVARVPSPIEAADVAPAGEPGPSEFWNLPSSTAGIDCIRCHGADPWIHSPWVDQLRHPDDDSRPYVPSGADPDRPYWVVGTAFSEWNDQLHHIRPEGNDCVSCHRIGVRESCERLVVYATGNVGGLPMSETGSAFPMSHWMPPASASNEAEWDAAWADDVQALLVCCRGPETEGCGLSAVPR